MFTGLIEELGTVGRVEKGVKSFRFQFRAAAVLEDTKVGASIAVNGVCLTVTACGPGYFTADVMPETVQRTTLAGLKTGDRVNLERALTLNQRLGGHLVQGHIDGVGRVLARQQAENALLLTISTPLEVQPYLVPKGSIAVDGVSLTVAALFPDSFQISLIPHSASATTLGQRQVGDLVNLEGDIIGKYVAGLLGRGPKAEVPRPRDEGLTRDFLARTGML